MAASALSLFVIAHAIDCMNEYVDRSVSLRFQNNQLSAGMQSSRPVIIIIISMLI